MKKLVLAIMIAVMGIGGVAMANDYVDNIGVYFDPEGTEICINKISEVGISSYHVYVILTQLTSCGVKGFEFALAFDGPLAAMNWTFPEGSGALNFQTPPVFLVGFSDYIFTLDRTVTVLEFDILVYSANPANWDENEDAHVFVKHIFFHSLPEELPAYLDDHDNIKALHQSTGTAADAVMIFSLNQNGCSKVIATEDTTWDSLKSLYR